VFENTLKMIREYGIMKILLLTKKAVAGGGQETGNLFVVALVAVPHCIATI